MDFLALLQQYMSVEAVLISVGLTQLIKGVLPQDPAKGRWSVLPAINRFLPFFPVLFGIATVVVKDHVVCGSAVPMPWDDAIIKGMISGFAGAYLYRTAQVTLFGK